MKENFDKALALVLRSEGGWVHHPADPGGETNLGVTRRVWEDFCGHTELDMRRLTKESVTPLYKKMYWDTVRCDDLPDGADYLAFDFAVNSGVFRCIKTIQRTVGVLEDGILGPMTLKAVQSDPYFIEAFSDAKEKFYRGLSTFPTFGRGWLNRVAESRLAAGKFSSQTA